MTAELKGLLRFWVIIGGLAASGSIVHAQGSTGRREDLQRVGARYQVDFLSDVDAWHDLSLDFSRLLSHGPVAARLNFARRFGTTGVQAELDAYPRLSSRSYLYLAVAASASDQVFIPFRAAVEPYVELGNWEASLGLRYFRVPSASVRVFTGSAGHYFGNYLISVRPYISVLDSERSYAGEVVWRKYFTGRYDYVSVALTGSRGLDPQARDPFRSSRRVSLTALGARVERRQPVSRGIRALFGAGWEREELAPGKFRRHATLLGGLEWFIP